MKKVLLALTLVLFAGSMIYSQTTAHMSNPPAPIMVKSQINNNHEPSGCKFLVFMDNLPWGYPSIQDILTANGEDWSLANSSQMATIDFSLYDVIIIASDQIPGFYTDFSANFSKFVTFVTNGGSLEVHAATCGWNSPCGYSVVLPGGVYTTESYDYDNVIVNAGHPIVAGVSNPFSGTYASHGYFSNLVTGTDIITTQSISSDPTTIQYTYGTGVVTATTCTYEYGYYQGQEAGEMLVNNLNYGCEHAIDAETPISNWAIGIGIFLIIGAALLRYKRLV